MDVFDELQQANDNLDKTVDKFITHYKKILGQIKATKAENEQLEAKIKELRSK